MEENKKKPAEEVKAENAENVLAEGTFAPETTVAEAETANGDALHGENLTERAKVLSPGMTVLKRFFRSKLSVIGLVTIVLLFLFAFLGPVFSPWAANGGTALDTNPELIKEILSASPVTYKVGDIEYEALAVSVRMPQVVKLGDISLSHWLGTDNMGYDVLTRLMYGGRVSLTIGFVVVIIETIIGVIMGGIAGYFGKWVDNVIMRIVDILSCIPSLPIMLILSVIFTNSGIGADISKLYYMMIVLCLIGWTGKACARADTFPARTGVYACRQGFGAFNRIQDIQASYAQRNSTAYSFYDVGAGQHYPYGSNARFLRHRRAARHGYLGQHNQPCQQQLLQAVLSQPLGWRGRVHYACNFGV